jgi:hypothetical protein
MVHDEALKIVMLFLQETEVVDCVPASWEAAQSLHSFMLVKPLPSTWAARKLMHSWSVEILLGERRLYSRLVSASDEDLRRSRRATRNEEARADYYMRIYHTLIPLISPRALADAGRVPGYVEESDTDDD